MRPTPILESIPDHDLASRYWNARGELQRLRHTRPSVVAARSGEELAHAFQRIRELDALCEKLWREGCRRTDSGTLAGSA